MLKTLSLYSIIQIVVLFTTFLFLNSILEARVSQEGQFILNTVNFPFWELVITCLISILEFTICLLVIQLQKNYSLLSKKFSSLISILISFFLTALILKFGISNYLIIASLLSLALVFSLSVRHFYLMSLKN
jgi:uncharacterized membrane protein